MLPRTYKELLCDLIVSRTGMCLSIIASDSAMPLGENAHALKMPELQVQTVI